jgi:hypothetical protein
MFQSVKALVIASPRGAASISYRDGIFALVEIPDRDTLSPATIRTMPEIEGHVLSFLEQEESPCTFMVILEDLVNKREYGFSQMIISPFTVKTDLGNYQLSPSTPLSDWVLTKVSNNDGTDIPAGYTKEGAKVRINEGELRLCDKEGKELFSAQLEQFI